MRLLYSTILLSVAFIFVSCQEENNGLRSPEREKAEAWAQAARELFWGEDRTLNLDTLPDVTPVVAMMDSAIALDPQNRQYYYQKAEYLALAEEVDALSAVFRQLAALGEDKTPFLPETLGQCFARRGETDSAKYYYTRAIELRRKERTPGLSSAFVDSAYIAHLEYYITGDRMAALRKIEQSAGATPLTESEKEHLEQILRDFDLDQLAWQPSAEEILRTKKLLNTPRKPLTGASPRK